ncbi:transposase [Bacillus cereus]|nr:transposase [Bacillus cereus]
MVDSIKMEKILPSTLLRKLSSNSKKKTIISSISRA